MKEFDHIGIVTSEPHEGESWVEFSKVWATNPRLHPQRIEYIRPAEMPEVGPQDLGLWKLWHLPHIAEAPKTVVVSLSNEPHAK